MIEEAKQSIRSILDTTKNPVIAWSGGRDSTLLLHLARQVKADIPVVWFKQNVSKAWLAWCESIIMEWDLVVFNYPSSDTYYLPNDELGQTLTLVDEYSFGSGQTMPVLTDVVSGSGREQPIGECAAEVSREFIPAFEYPWDVTLTGYRESDSHFILGTRFFPKDGTLFGNTKLYAPLRRWADVDVARATQALRLPSSPPDERLYRCNNCLRHKDRIVFCPEVGKEIQSISWDKNQALMGFRSRFVPQMIT